MTQSRHHRHFPGLVTTIALVGVLAAACGGYTPELVRIDVTPDANVAANGSQQFTAVGRDAKGELFAITPAWAVVANGGTINGNGLFTAGPVAGRFPGTVQASSGNISGLANVVVTTSGARTGLATITVTPLGPDSIMVGGTRQFVVVARDSAGTVMSISPTWSVVSGGGTINSTGLFTAGPTTGVYSNSIRAVSGRISGYSSVIVAHTVNSMNTMSEMVHFAYNRSDLNAASRTALDAKVAVLENNRAMRIVVVGHADSRGTADYNLDLGTRRAAAVKAYLVAAGVNSNRIDIDTRGEGEPMAAGSSENAMAQNRRGVFTIRN